MSRTDSIKVVVAALTRRRPAMLCNLLQSWGETRIPEHCDVTFLVVENDDFAMSQSLVEMASPLQNGAALVYVREPQVGIPFGRNRAAREAIAIDADLLAFVDDDETVDVDWLTHIIDGFLKSGAMLVGAPLRTAPATQGLTHQEQIMYDAISRRYRRKEDRATELTTLGDCGPVKIVTNNWLADTKLFSEHDIWFDEALRLTGGTDAKFHAEVKARGLPIGWVPNALVFEEIPRERLSFRYQCDRARDQVNSNLRRKLEKSPVRFMFNLLYLPVKLVLICILICLTALRPKTWAMDLARAIGWVRGILGLLSGRRSDLYRKVTGN